MADTRAAALRHASSRRRYFMNLRRLVLGAAYGPHSLLVELLGWPRASLVCRCWRDAARQIRLTRAEEAKLVRAINEQPFVGQHLLANLHYYKPRTLDLRRCRGTGDFAITAMASRCSHFKEIDLGFCDKISDAAIVKLASCCPNMSVIHLTR